MKIGTIICNHWAGENNPVKYFIYTGLMIPKIKIVIQHGESNGIHQSTCQKKQQGYFLKLLM